MRNLISRNELASWKWDEKATIDQKYDQVSEYFHLVARAHVVCRLDIITWQEVLH